MRGPIHNMTFEELSLRFLKAEKGIKEMRQVLDKINSGNVTHQVNNMKMICHMSLTDINDKDTNKFPAEPATQP